MRCCLSYIRRRYFISSGAVHGAEIETYDDHRVAMAFTVTGLVTGGMIIDNPMCCRKTFENYYEVLEKLIEEITMEKMNAGIFMM